MVEGAQSRRRQGTQPSKDGDPRFWGELESEYKADVRAEREKAEEERSRGKTKAPKPEKESAGDDNGDSKEAF